MFDAYDDPAIAKSYSLRRSQHEGLRTLAAFERHNNATRVLARIVEEYFRAKYGPQWFHKLEEKLELEAQIRALREEQVA